MSYGGAPYGVGVYGGLTTPFDLVTAVAVDNRTVNLTFSVDVLSATGTYSFDGGLTEVTAIQVSSNVIQVTTSPQIGGYLYTVTVTGVLGLLGQSLVNNVATFTGLSAATNYVVSNLSAKTWCSGRAIYLSWTNPASPAHVQIVRRLRAWPFDLTDDHEVVYDSSTVISSFMDTGVLPPYTTIATAVGPGTSTIEVVSSAGYAPGDLLRVELPGVRYDLAEVQSTPDATHVTFTAPLTRGYSVGDRVAKSAQLQEQTYYYYLVLVTPSLPASYAIDDASRTYALSIAELDSAAWLRKNTPRVYFERDEKRASEHGGGGYLRNWYEVMGCWLNLMRGYAQATKLLGDPDKVPYHFLELKNLAWGIQPEGYAYDFDVLRRPLAFASHIYKVKGTCPGIVETVTMFTKWDSVCADFGSGGCRSGATTIKTWDGDSQLVFGSGTSSISQSINEANGAGIITDTGATFSSHLFVDGQVVSKLGDVACVADNTATALTTKAPTAVAETVGAESAGATSFQVSDTSRLYPGMVVQITDVMAPGPTWNAEVFQIYSITPGSPGTISLQGVGLENSYLAHAMISVGKSILRREYLGTASSTHAGQVLTDPRAYWVENQWIGFQLLDASNVLHSIVSNTGNTVTVDGAAPADGTYSIAYGITPGGSFSARTVTQSYTVRQGTHTTIFEPTMDTTERGTINDPFHRIYGGPGASISGVYGPSDVGVYIEGNIPVAIGKAATFTGPNFPLDSSQAAPSVDAWVGYYLNPNQNQEQLFEIIANSATTVTVAGDVSSLVSAGQYYYVLKPRDRVRFSRVSRRLRDEFTDTDTKTHVLFV